MIHGLSTENFSSKMYFFGRYVRMTNNYIHDSLAAGMTAKGASEVLLRGNIVERAGCSASSSVILHI